MVVWLEGPASPVNEDWKLNFNWGKAVKATKLQYETSNLNSTGTAQTRNKSRDFEFSYATVQEENSFVRTKGMFRHRKCSCKLLVGSISGARIAAEYLHTYVK